jgi:hypothetical protein
MGSKLYNGIASFSRGNSTMVNMEENYEAS